MSDITQAAIAGALFAVGMLMASLYYYRRFRHWLGDKCESSSPAAKNPDERLKYRFAAIIVLLVVSAILLIILKYQYFGDLSGEQFRARTGILTMNCNVVDMAHTRRPVSVYINDQFSDEHVGHLSKLTDLRRIEINNARIDATEFRMLNKLHIESIYFNRIRNSNRTVERLLESLPHLVAIEFKDTEVDSFIVDGICKLPRVREVALYGTSVAASDIARMRTMGYYVRVENGLEWRE